MKKNLTIAFVAGLLALASGYLLLNLRDSYLTRANTQVLEDIVFNTLARTERSIDQSLSQIGELYAAGAINCSGTTEKAVSELVFKSSSVKGAAFYVDGAVCQTANTNQLLAFALNDTEDAMLARNENISFKGAKVSDLRGLVMNWKLSDSEQVTAFFNTNELVFDMLPLAIRDYANLEIFMSDGAMLGFLRDDMTAESNYIQVSKASERYPLEVKLTMSPAVMQAWRTDLPLITRLFGGLGLFGIFFLMTRGLSRPADTAQSIKRALRNGSIVPYYQPVYSVRSGELLGFEVLARRLGKGGVLMSPATFIPLIEKYELGDQLLEVLLRNAAKNMDLVLDEAQAVTLAFNVTPQQISREGFAGWFVDLLLKTEIAPDRIILEVTEREAINDLSNLQKNISQLRDYDITIAIDDVGTGHNGLSSIHQLRADYLKIDKLFVDGVVMDEHAAALVKMLIDVGAQYGMQIIAEGVENEEQLEALRKLGVDEVQGYYMARPMPASDAVIEFSHHRAVRTKLILAEGLRKSEQEQADVAQSA